MSQVPIRSGARVRATVTASAALTLVAAAALGVPTATLGAQGDDEVVIGIIEQVTPAVVTIQAPLGGATEIVGDSQEDLELPDGLELPEGQEMPQSLEELEDLLPEGIELPEGFELPEGLEIPFGGQGGFQFPGGTGSGVIISSDGLIITNGHVVGDAEDVQVILHDGTVLDGTVTGVDTLTDFAFVKVDGQDLPTVTLGDSSDLKVGQLAISIGNPLGQFPGSAAIGIISGLDRSIGVFGSSLGGQRLNHLIQTDAAVNSGNSGGALFDGDGELIGITTAEAGMSDGIGFALPIDLAKPIIAQAQAGEAISRPYVGVLYREIDAQVAADESLPVTAGAWIRGEVDGESPIVEGSPADEAGLKAGDIITAVNGVAVDGDNPLDLQVLRFAPGEEVTLAVIRDGETLDLAATLGTRPADLGQ